MKRFSIAARINVFLILVIVLVLAFAFISTQKLSKDLLSAISVESVLQKKAVSDRILTAEQILELGVDPKQWQSFLQDEQMIDLGFLVQTAGGDELFWVEKTNQEQWYNVRSTKNRFGEYLIRLALDYALLLLGLFVVCVPLIFALSIVLLQPMGELRKIAENVLAGNYDVGHIPYTASDDLGRSLVAIKKLSEDLKRNQVELEKVSELAIRDALTGLKNHRAFQQAVQREIAMAKRHKRELGIVLLDVDKFKKFNDTYGHQQGDEVLKVVGKCLEAEARTSDLVARYGGEEFVILLPETGKDGIFMACEKFRKALAQQQVAHLNEPGKFLSVTASFGGVVVTADDITSTENPEEYKKFVEVCDNNLYKAKDKGRNCSVVSAMRS